MSKQKLTPKLIAKYTKNPKLAKSKKITLPVQEVKAVAVKVIETVPAWFDIDSRSPETEVKPKKTKKG